MPIIDSKRGVLVVRIVYDGPPLSGKTTSLRALAAGLGVDVTTPEEKDGRTLFFDWIDYVGGLFEGRQIRCQIVSVPGQDELAARRRELLASADAVVLVADTREPALPEALRVLAQLLPHCRAQEPPVGVVLQANKRDARDSVPRERLHAELGAIAPLAIVDTVATAGDGVREAFVFAVRLALDRVRALTGRLPEGEPEVSSAEDLLARLKALEPAPLRSSSERSNKHPSERPRALGPRNTLQPPALAPLGTAPHPRAPSSHPVINTAALDQEIALLSSTHSDSAAPCELVDELAFVPDPMMPGGFIWPPVDGRVLLHEVAELGIAPVRTARGDFWASGRGCLFHSAHRAIYPDADRGRQALIEWARLHATHLRSLSAGRTVVLAAAGGGRYRLWQLIRAEQALRERLAASLAHVDPAQLAGDLADAAAHLLEARATLHTGELRLPCTLWTVSGELKSPPRFVGLMPEVGRAAPEEPEGAELIARELTPLFRALVHQRDDVDRVIDALLGARARTRGATLGLDPLLAQLLASASARSAQAVAL